MSMTDRQPVSINPPYRIFMSLSYCMAGQRFFFKIDDIDWIRRNRRNLTIEALLCVVCVCLFVCARPASCGGIHGAFLPGLLMRAVRLPDNLAKENLHSKSKHRHADPGNDGEGNLKEAHKHRQLHTRYCANKRKRRRHPRRAQALPE